ncbi:unnamed protein product [Microthlaspi erraticum]|uniref:PGG domain-containing protein n=1 Tax=Microthlaspi erraticum TaxID=1685480 RepID=A0A6D2JHS1_9BRAS|nr:unnamed protein product [Microthlaspi erraticum]
MIVTTLITTVIFASIFTVPGGSDEKGLPTFGNQHLFTAFILSAGLGLSTSLASLLTFLSVITSRYKEEDFRVSLPRKLMIGLVTLYLSFDTLNVGHFYHDWP